METAPGFCSVEASVAAVIDGNGEWMEQRYR